MNLHPPNNPTPYPYPESESFIKSYLANYCYTDSPQQPTKQDLANILLKCEKEKELNILEMSRIKEIQLKFTDDNSITEKWSDSATIISKALNDLIANAQEVTELTKMKKELDTDIRECKKRLNKNKTSLTTSKKAKN